MLTRREFTGQVGSCMAHLALVGLLTPRSALASWAPRRPVVAQEKFGRLEQIDASTWALISTPLTGDRTTLSNGGIVAGTNGVLAIEGFASQEGARWLAQRARELTGRWPTHVLSTHYHSDHIGGIAGYVDSSVAARPQFLVTPATRELTLAAQPADEARSEALRNSRALLGDESLDLGGRVMRISVMSGHTVSDLVVEDAERSIVFCGDLVWNAMVPNFVDAEPRALRSSAASLARGNGATYVPGHGGLAGPAAYATYVEMLDVLEAGARAAHGAGTSAKDAASAFRLPDSLGEWVLFSQSFFQRAFEAWYRVL